MPAPRPIGRTNAPGQTRQHRRSARERKGQRNEPGEPARLRDGDRVREVREHPHEQLDPEDRERPAEDESRPALTRGERRERDEDERRDGDCAATRHHLGPQRVAME